MKYQCEKCGKSFVDRETTRRKRVEGQDGVYIENEFLPLCNTCLKKWLKSERKKAWLNQALISGHITKEELQRYANKEICERDMFLLIQERKKNPTLTKEKMELESA